MAHSVVDFAGSAFVRNAFKSNTLEM